MIPDIQRREDRLAFAFFPSSVLDLVSFGNRKLLDRFIDSQCYQPESAFGKLWYAILFKEPQQIQEKFSQVSLAMRELIQKEMGEDKNAPVNIAFLNHALYRIFLTKLAILAKSLDSIRTVASYIESKGGRFELTSTQGTHPLNGNPIPIVWPRVDKVFLLIDALESLPEAKSEEGT